MGGPSACCAGDHSVDRARLAMGPAQRGSCAVVGAAPSASSPDAAPCRRALERPALRGGQPPQCCPVPQRLLPAPLSPPRSDPPLTRSWPCRQCAPTSSTYRRSCRRPLPPRGRAAAARRWSRRCRQARPARPACPACPARPGAGRQLLSDQRSHACVPAGMSLQRSRGAGARVRAPAASGALHSWRKGSPALARRQAGSAGV